MRPKIVAEAEEKMKKRVAGCAAELATVRTGRASAAILDRIVVDYYGTKTALKQMATITVPEPQLMVIQPWDKNVLSEIEKALLQSDLGLTPNNDGTVIRLSFPPLSEERRQELVKITKKIAEEGRVSIRQVRRETNENLKKLEKDKVMSEDERERTQEDIQKITDKYIAEVDELLKHKEEAIMEV